MTHDVKIVNNTGATRVLNMLAFFTRISGPQVVTLTPGAEAELQAECYPPQAARAFKAYCQAQGIDYGKNGLWVLMTVIEPVAE